MPTIDVMHFMANWQTTLAKLIKRFIVEALVALGTGYEPVGKL